MANLQKFVVVLLVLTIVLSTISVIFNLVIYKMSSENKVVLEKFSSNSGNIGLIVERNNNSLGGSGG